MTRSVIEDERRLPVYLLLDTSEGMTGPPIEALRRGVEQFRLEIQGDTFALETVWVGIITFGGRAEFVTKGLVPRSQLVMPPLTAGGQNVLGEALHLLIQSLDKDITPPTKGGSKGDWRPLIFILLGSEPTDDWREPRERIQQREQARICTAVTVGCGPCINQQNLRDIAIGEIFDMDNDDASFRALFRWVGTTTSDEGSLINAQEDRGVSITATPPFIDLGCLVPGTSPCTIVRIEGGPARATTDSERIRVMPSEISEKSTDIEVTIKEGSDGELIWDTLCIKGDRGELEIPVICMWDEALSRSFKEPTRRTYPRRMTQPVEPEEETGATPKHDTTSKDETEPVNSAVPTEPLAATPGERTYIAQFCPYCGGNFRYDSDSRTWVKCNECTGARRLISVPRRVVSETRLGIKNDGKKILRDLWEVITGKQDWNLR